MSRAKTVRLKPSEVTQVAKWIIAGHDASDITEAVRASKFDGEPGPLILAAMGRLKRAANFDPMIMLGWCVEATRELYRKMVESGDYAGALRAVKQMERMAVNVRDQDEEDDTEAGEADADSEDADALACDS